MKAILEQEEINLINQILADFPIRELNKVQQIMKIIESKIETEETEDVDLEESNQPYMADICIFPQDDETAFPVFISKNSPLYIRDPGTPSFEVVFDVSPEGRFK